MDERLCFLFCLIFAICTGYTESQGDNFCGERVPCDDWECIDRGKWCNGETDCFDESDEKYCRTISWLGFGGVDNKCTEQHFKCNNDQCVPVVTKCDGYENCKDGSDEYDCDEKSSETSLSNEDTISEDTSEDNTDEDFWDAPVTTTERETSFSDIFDSSEPPVISLIPSSMQDYYSRRMSKEPTDRQKQAGRNQEFAYNSRRDHHQQPYPGRQNEPRQQSQHHDTRTRTELTRQSETFRGSPHYSGGSHTAPAPSFPSNVHRPVPPLPLHHPDPSPPTADPTSFSPSPSSVDKDTERLQEFDSTRQEAALSPFHFRQNYTLHFSYRYKDSIQRAESWIFDQRDSAYGWGMDTPRALVTLSLINNSFSSNATGKNFMKKSLQMHLGLKLLTELDTNNYFKTSGNSIKLAQYINALIATCQNPRNFFGQNLVEHLWQMKNDVLERERFVNPFIYITLCLANATITNHDIGVLESVLASRDPNQRSKDIQIFAATALACLQHNKPELDLNREVEKAFNDLRSRKLRDGSFGNVHSTAIAAQALMSGNIDWDPVQTLDYLKQHQSEDGSFGNMLATYYILPSLCGRSLLHLRNTRCDPLPTDEEGSHIRVLYTVKIGYPPTASIPNVISVPGGTNFFDVLRIAQLMNPVFKFSYYNSNGKIGVHGISGVVDDPEHGFYWHLYELGNQTTLSPNRSQEYTGDIRKLYPTNSQELVYWYHNL